MTPSSIKVASPTPASPGPEAAVIDVIAVTKTFGRTRALHEVSMTVRAGEARALVGRNGAGKSTLVSLLTGLHRPDSGTLTINGESAADADAVACVYQRSRMVPALTVAENVVLGDYPRGVGGLISWRGVRAQAEAHLRSWGLADLADTPVERLDAVQAKVVEICRALKQQPSVLLLDEPTAGLDKRDAERLFTVIDQLKAQGVTLIYVSHHLEEIYRLCDTATVLRDARHIVTADLSELPMRALVDAMVGDEAPAEVRAHVPDEAQSGAPTTATAAVRRRVAADAPVRLQVSGVSVAGLLQDFELAVRRGECVGVAGLDGSGKAEVGTVLAGLLAPDAGEVAVDGRRIGLGDVRTALRAGIAYVPEDRHARGMVPQLDISENATMTATRSILRRPLRRGPGVLLTRDRDRAYRELAGHWEIVASGPRQLIAELSGGNQQKCVMARALGTDPSVLVMHNPTAGIDVAAKASIMRTLDGIFAAGACGVVISEDPDDFALCSRILVVVKGRVATCLGTDWTEGDLVSAMQGADQ
jgi:simple sugar transport system ATP-binding protein